MKMIFWVMVALFTVVGSVAQRPHRIIGSYNTTSTIVTNVTYVTVTNIVTVTNTGSIKVDAQQGSTVVTGNSNRVIVNPIPEHPLVMSSLPGTPQWTQTQVQYVPAPQPTYQTPVYAPQPTPVYSTPVYATTPVYSTPVYSTPVYASGSYGVYYTSRSYSCEPSRVYGFGGGNHGGGSHHGGNGRH